jgi:hypothetical protein
MKGIGRSVPIFLACSCRSSVSALFVSGPSPLEHVRVDSHSEIIVPRPPLQSSSSQPVDGSRKRSEADR